MTISVGGRERGHSDLRGAETKIVSLYQETKMLFADDVYYHLVSRDRVRASSLQKDISSLFLNFDKDEPFVYDCILRIKREFFRHIGVGYECLGLTGLIPAHEAFGLPSATSPSPSDTRICLLIGKPLEDGKLEGLYFIALRIKDVSDIFLSCVFPFEGRKVFFNATGRRCKRVLEEGRRVLADAEQEIESVASHMQETFTPESKSPPAVVRASTTHVEKMVEYMKNKLGTDTLVPRPPMLRRCKAHMSTSFEVNTP